MYIIWMLFPDWIGLYAQKGINIRPKICDAYTSHNDYSFQPSTSVFVKINRLKLSYILVIVDLPISSLFKLLHYSGEMMYFRWLFFFTFICYSGQMTFFCSA
jgi:hypothetical protein